MPTREELPEFARNHQLGKLAVRTEPVYNKDGDLTDEELKHLASEGDYDADTEFVDEPDDAEVVLSLTGQKIGDTVPLHRPVFDVDFPVSAIPSSTPGHFHLYLDKELTWLQYRRLLEALNFAGIIEGGYLQASVARGFTSVRMPSVKKAAPVPVDL
ncbi:hypothetical protein QEH68_06595 [Paenarthrobacter sp. OM7]|uniref:hypothetical protein n=1 Tax=Paenarthrobacter sp. OM7 TaxID=3041264 RepID=UPI0024685A7C|nr:hypothetical protein [Paenarthrobacter sp. OM7]WGM21837.1 hypothetical protein QEH68_06595 [Paenarthrobacter sp. OM7]